MYTVKRLLCLCFFVLALSSCGTIAFSATSSPTPESIVHKPTKPTPASSRVSVASTPTPAVSSPTRLLIPSIGVDASVENIGVLPNGDLATPTQSPWVDVGWYHLGPRPGENGSAVIAGHLDRPGGYPAVFWNLRYVQPGAIVTVVPGSGTSLRFRVTQVAAYPPNQAPLQQIFANPGGKYLNLITCAGDWIPSQHQTTLRLVVYTKLI